MMSARWLFVVLWTQHCCSDDSVEVRVRRQVLSRKELCYVASAGQMAAALRIRGLKAQWSWWCSRKPDGRRQW
jgi:hypothetical protein